MSVFELKEWVNKRDEKMLTKYNVDLKSHIILAKDITYIDKKSNSQKAKNFNYCSVQNISALEEILNENLHLYEILPPNEPLHLFFDLELYGKWNAEMCQERLNLFMTWLLNELKSITGSDMTPVYLNSCTPEKFSYHVIFPHFYFDNMAHQKSLIQFLKGRMDNETEEFKRPFSGEKNYIFDTSVYDPYQQIRLCGQSKILKSQTLKLEGDFTIRDTWIRCYNNDIKNMTKLEPSQWDKTAVSSHPIQKKDKKPQSRESNKTTNWEKFIYKGPTLREQKNHTNKELEQYPLWKQYLYLIPNIGQSWDNWRNVGMAIKECGGTMQDWDDWSRLAKGTNKRGEPLYNEGECDVFRNFRKGVRGFQNVEHNFNILSLKRLAKIACPAYFVGRIPAFSTYFDLDTTGMNVIVEDTPFVSYKNDNILTNTKFLCLHAYMGLGKTTAICRLLEVRKYSKVLILSSRQTFASFMASEFEMDNYLDMKGDPTLMNKSNKLVISVESLYKISMEYECIIMDEIESIMTQFSSPTLNGQCLKIFEKLVFLIRNAKQVITADAFLTNRSILFMKDFGEPITLIQNKNPPKERVAECLSTKIRFSGDLMKFMGKGKKPYMCFSSKTDLIQFEDDLKTYGATIGINQDKIDKRLFYHSKTNDAIFATMKDMNVTWKAASMVATSPSTTIGCSYSPKDEHLNPSFDAVFVNAKPTCCIRDKFQMTMRVRHLKENTMYFCLPTKKQQECAKRRHELIFETLYEFENYNDQKAKNCFDLCNYLIEKEDPSNFIAYSLTHMRDNYGESRERTPEALRKILWFNLFEMSISGYYFNELFYEFLKRCNYKFSPYLESNKKEELHEVLGVKEIVKDEVSILEKYKTLQPITFSEQEDIALRIKTKQATEVEKLQIEKYWYEKHCRKGCDASLTEEEKAKGFEYIWLIPEHKKFLQNAIVERTDSLSASLESDHEKSGKVIELNDNTACRLSVIRKINERLKVNHSFESHKIDREQIETMIPFMSENRTLIQNAFGFKERSKPDTKRDTYEATVKLLKSIYKSWSNMEIKVVDSKKHKSQAYKFIPRDMDFLKYV